jgi:hypothetical protein
VLYRVKINGISELKILGSFSNKEKIYRFLNFFLNDKILLTWVKDAWTTKFDYDYVIDNLINPLFE